MEGCGFAAAPSGLCCSGLSRVCGALFAAAVPRLQPLSLLAALPALMGGGLAWAQLEASQPEAPASAPVPPLLPPPGSTAGPLRPDPARLSGAATAPKRFDQSLDELVRQGVVTPSERNLVRGGGGLAPLDVGAFQQACRGGALSARECRGGIALRWGRRGGSTGNTALGGRIGADGMPLPPLTVPVSALLAGNGGSFNLASVFRVTPRPAPVLGNGNRRLLLPIIGSAVNTSGFGWRLHPLLGAWRLHAGEDLAAPEGTPVVAALSGKVVSSGLAGGYGLAVEVEHQRPLRRSLYGHLSELYVKAGDVVRQGEVIGRVGSTGLSTGPHLHFELREPAAGGWVAIDPGDFDPGNGLQGSDAIALLMGQLLQSLERPVAKG
ncbi:MAG: hypothetical protein RLZZ515_523 [Cyanobacteriota bacterium]